MHDNDLQSEWAFYGPKLDTIGQLYLRSAKLPAKNPDALFFLLYTCRLLVEKKLTISGVNFIRNNLEHTRERWLDPELGGSACIHAALPRGPVPRVCAKLP